MSTRGTPGTNPEGVYLVRQLMDYADSLLSLTNNYITINTQWPTEVFIVYAAITPVGPVDSYYYNLTVGTFVCAGMHSTV